MIISVDQIRSMECKTVAALKTVGKISDDRQDMISDMVSTDMIYEWQTTSGGMQRCEGGISTINMISHMISTDLINGVEDFFGWHAAVWARIQMSGMISDIISIDVIGRLEDRFHCTQQCEEEFETQSVRYVHAHAQRTCLSIERRETLT